MAFESFIFINQLNGNVRVSQKRLAPLVKKVIYGEQHDADGRTLARLVPHDTPTDLRRIKSHNAEDRQNRWTNHKNITMWFDNWEHDLVELGFAFWDETTGKAHIPTEMLRLIGNFDETNLLLCGATTNCGGQLEVLIYVLRFPMVGKATSKSSLSLIAGSTAASKPFPPHIQFMTKAKLIKTMQLDVDVAEHVPQVLEQSQQEGRDGR